MYSAWVNGFQIKINVQCAVLKLIESSSKTLDKKVSRKFTKRRQDEEWR